MPQPGAWERVMGLDVGERRIGLAFASALGVGTPVALPAGFLLVRSPERAVADLVELAEEEGVGAVVLGLPFQDGRPTRQSDKILALGRKLRAALPGDVDMYGWDESYSSAAAQGLLVQAELKHSGKAKRGRVDAVAAALILQSFMDAHRNLGLAQGALLIGMGA